MDKNKEQIMIDGVDVSVCILRRRKEPNCTVCNAYSSKVFEFDCSDFKNCYFKQLKRKEQECEEKDKSIKFLLEKLDLSNNRIQDCEIHWEKEKKNLQQQLDQLKGEKEQLKEELSAIQHNCNREGCKYYDDDTFKVFYECKAQKALQLSANSVTTKYCDLLKTLTEIKEIAEEAGNTQYLTFPDFNLKQNAKMLMGQFNGYLKQILQKISECEVNYD